MHVLKDLYRLFPLRPAIVGQNVTTSIYFSLFINLRGTNDNSEPGILSWLVTVKGDYIVNYFKFDRTVLVPVQYSQKLKFAWPTTIFVIPVRFTMLKRL